MIIFSYICNYKNESIMNIKKVLREDKYIIDNELCIRYTCNNSVVWMNLKGEVLDMGRLEAEISKGDF